MAACFLVLLIILANSGSAFADSFQTLERTVTKLADGVYEIRHKDATADWPSGNTTVIIGDRGAFVVDSCVLPSAAREDIAQIRQWTDKPVRYLLNTHWHIDHNAGNAAYKNAFPALDIIAQTQTRKMMDYYNPGVPARFVAGYEKQYAKLRSTLLTRKDDAGKPLSAQQLKDTEREAALERNFIEEYKTFVYVSPTMTFDREIKIDLGNREVQVKFLGRGNTGGDAVVYLPGEKILVTGDLLDHPVPYVLDGYPSEWIQTLEAMAQLDAETIVPGHGDVLHDKAYIYEVRDLFKSVIAQVNEQISQKHSDATLEEVKKTINVDSFRQQMVGDPGKSDKATAEFFEESIASGLVELVFHELKQR